MASKEPGEGEVTDRGFNSYKDLKTSADCSKVKCDAAEGSSEHGCWSCMGKISWPHTCWPPAAMKNSSGSSLKNFAETQFYQGNKKMETLLTSSMYLSPLVSLLVVGQRPGRAKVEGASRHSPNPLLSEPLLDCKLFKTYPQHWSLHCELDGTPVCWIKSPKQIR